MSSFEGAVRKDSFRQIGDTVSTMIEVVYKFLILSIIIETYVEGLRSKNRKAERQGNRFYRAKNDRIFYYQVAYMLTDEKTREREFGVYKSIEDNFPKYVLSMDRVDFGRDGVIHKNIVDFLSETV